MRPGSAGAVSADWVLPVDGQPLRNAFVAWENGRITEIGEGDWPAIYHRDTKPLVEYYRRRPTFRIVNGAQAPEFVARDLAAAIDGVAGATARAVADRRGSRLESLL